METNRMQRVIRGIPSELGRTCLLSSIVTAVRYLRPEAGISEAILLGVGAGLSFRYGYYEKPGAAYPIAMGLPDITCFHIDLDRDRFVACLKRFGIALEERPHSSIAEIVEAVNSDVTQGRPVMVILNDRHLDYLPEKLRKDAARFVICHGWDDSSGIAWVTDQVIPSSPPSFHQGPMSADNFVRALSLREVVYDDTYATWHFFPTGEPVGLTAADVAASVERSYQEMLNGGGRSYRFGISRVVYRCGAEAIRSLADDLKRRAGMEISDDVRLWLKELYALLAMHAGPVTARPLYAGYLAWAKEEGLASLSSSMARQSRQLGEEWATIANMLYKAAVARDTACVERTAQRVLSVAAREQALLSELRDGFGESG